MLTVWQRPGGLWIAFYYGVGVFGACPLACCAAVLSRARQQAEERP